MPQSQNDGWMSPVSAIGEIYKLATHAPIPSMFLPLLLLSSVLGGSTTSLNPGRPDRFVGENISRSYSKMQRNNKKTSIQTGSGGDDERLTSPCVERGSIDPPLLSFAHPITLQLTSRLRWMHRSRAAVKTNADKETDHKKMGQQKEGRTMNRGLVTEVAGRPKRDQLAEGAICFRRSPAWRSSTLLLPHTFLRSEYALPSHSYI